MNDQSRRRILLSGAALGLTGVALAACNPTDTGSNNTTQPPGGGGDNSTGAAPGGNNPTGPGGAPGPAARIRYDVASAEGQQMLAIYAKAVTLMMAMPESDPRSWTFQWYSHWVKGDGSDAGKISEMARIFPGASTPAQALAQKMWDGCQAHGDNEDENFFLPWHRMFVMAFENIIRAVAEAPDFTLPYWNWLDPDQRAIPVQFRRPNDATWGALYRSTRNASVNAGGPIASDTALSPEVMSENSYSPLGADQGFCANLDGGLHGTVHVGVGNATTGMGVVPWAANDPVFWLHHANIDRLWASWNANGNANPSDAAFTSKPFPFADASGNQVLYSVSQVLSLALAGYSYDALVAENGAPATQQEMRTEAVTRTAPVPGNALPAPVASAAPNPAAVEAPKARMLKAPPVLKGLPSITHVAEGVQLGAGKLRVRLAQAGQAPAAVSRSLAPMVAPPVRMQHAAPAQPSGPSFPFLKSAPPPKVGATPAPPAPPAAIPAPKPGQKVFLVISNLTTDIQPGVLYQVYLEAPAKTKGGATQPFAVGTLNFFSAMHEMGGMKMANRSRSFDITDLADQLAQQGRLEANPQVSFSPVGKPAAQAQPLIGSVSLAIQ